MLAAALGFTTAVFHGILGSLRQIVLRFASIDVNVLRAVVATIMCPAKRTPEGEEAVVRKRTRQIPGLSSSRLKTLAARLENMALRTEKGLAYGDSNFHNHFDGNGSGSANVGGKPLRSTEINPPTTGFPQFRKMPPELRFAVWDKAADFGCDIKLQQSCQCSFKPKELYFKVDNLNKVTPKDEEDQFKGKGNANMDVMEATRRRLALLHVCHESRTYLGPRYDAFRIRTDQRTVRGTGTVESPDDLFLRPSRDISANSNSNSSRGGSNPGRGVILDYDAIREGATGRYQKAAVVPPPVLTWKISHYYPGLYVHGYSSTTESPHVLLDAQQDTFSGRLNWTGNPWCHAKFRVQHCALERPESPLPTLDPGRALEAPSVFEKGKNTSRVNVIFSLLNPE